MFGTRFGNKEVLKMAHYFSEGGFTVIQAFGYRFEIIDRKRNKILSSSVLPIFQQKGFRIGKYEIKLNKI